MNAGDIKQLARDRGFALCGIAEARPSDHGDHFRQWLAEGKHGEMAYLARNVRTRLDPRQLLPGAKSIICVADYIGPPSPQDSKFKTQDSGLVARYAQVSDYHKVIKKRLHGLADALRREHPDAQFRVCVDTAPIMEREHAARAGLGWIGKHTLLLDRRLGSHLLLGEIVTTLTLTPDAPQTDHCGGCTRCIDACPTDCITPYAIDASQCISYLTIEHRTEINLNHHRAMDRWIFGCDVCQQVCPYVKKSSPAALPPGYQPHRQTLNPLEVLNWTEDDRRSAFTGSAMKRAKLDMMHRNAAIVVANIRHETEG